jgi:hypothetical protein
MVQIKCDCLSEDLARMFAIPAPMNGEDAGTL